MYCCHLFSIPSASVGIYHFCPLLSHLCMKCSLAAAGLSPFYCSPLLLCIDHLGQLSYLSLLFFGTLHSDRFIFPFLLSFSLVFYSQLFARPPQTAISLFLCFFFLGMVLVPVSCTMSQTSIHSSSGTLSYLIP